MNTVIGFASSPSNSTTVLQDDGKLVILLDHNEPGYFIRSKLNLLFYWITTNQVFFARSQPNLLFCWITMNQAVLQANNQTCYFMDHNEPLLNLLVEQDLSQGLGIKCLSTDNKKPILGQI